jgi:hypothetical protein
MRYVIYICFYAILNKIAVQEVKAAAAEALKEMAAYEKQEVGLEEKRKHANSKAKKLKKSLHDVWISALHVRLCTG